MSRYGVQSEAKGNLCCCLQAEIFKLGFLLRHDAFNGWYENRDLTAISSLLHWRQLMRLKENETATSVPIYACGQCCFYNLILLNILLRTTTRMNNEFRTTASCCRKHGFRASTRENLCSPLLLWPLCEPVSFRKTGINSDVLNLFPIFDAFPLLSSFSSSSLHSLHLFSFSSSVFSVVSFPLTSSTWCSHWKVDDVKSLQASATTAWPQFSFCV